MALQGVHVFTKHGNTVIVKFLYIDDTIAVTVSRGPTPNKDRTKFLNLFTHTVHVKFRSCASVMRQDGGRVREAGDGDTALSVHRRTSLRNVVDDNDDV